MDTGEDTEETSDAVGELLNMTIGATKSHYPFEEDPFRISLPTLVIGVDYVVHMKTKTGNDIGTIEYRLDGNNTYLGLRMLLGS